MSRRPPTRSTQARASCVSGSALFQPLAAGAGRQRGAAAPDADRGAPAAGGAAAAGAEAGGQEGPARRARPAPLTRTPGTSRDLDVMVSLAETTGGQQDALCRRGARPPAAPAGRAGPQPAADGGGPARPGDRAAAPRPARGAGARRRRALQRAGAPARDARPGRRRALDLLASLGERFDADTLHEVRIGLRRLRYAAEVQDLLKGVRSDATRLFKELQERLGPCATLSCWRYGSPGRHSGRAQRTGRPRPRGARARGTFRRDEPRHHRDLLESQPDDSCGTRSRRWDTAGPPPDRGRTRGG